MAKNKENGVIMDNLYVVRTDKGHRDSGRFIERLNDLYEQIRPEIILEDINRIDESRFRRGMKALTNYDAFREYNTFSKVDINRKFNENKLVGDEHFVSEDYASKNNIRCERIDLEGYRTLLNALHGSEEHYILRLQKVRHVSKKLNERPKDKRIIYPISINCHDQDEFINRLTTMCRREKFHKF